MLRAARRTLTPLENKTNVRISFWTRLGVRTLGLFSPQRAEKLAVRVFFTPPRAKAPVGPTPDSPEPRRRGGGAPRHEPGSHRFSLEVGDHRLAAWEWGEGPTVLLVHGWGGQAHQMSAFVSPFVSAGFHVVTFDQPAHGFSSGEHVTVLDLANAVSAVSFKFRPIHGIVAHSLGATATTIALARGTAVERAALIAPPAEPTYYARAIAAGLGMSPTRTEGMLNRIRETLRVDFDRVDIRKLAPLMSSELLLVHDPEDREVPFAHGLATAQAWPAGRLERARGLGHRRMLKDPDVIEKVVRFMSARDAALERKPA